MSAFHGIVHLGQHFSVPSWKLCRSSGLHFTELERDLILQVFCLNLITLLSQRIFLRRRKCKLVVYSKFKNASKVCIFHFKMFNLIFPTQTCPWITIRIIIHISICCRIIFLLWNKPQTERLKRLISLAQLSVTHSFQLFRLLWSFPPTTHSLSLFLSLSRK